MSCPHLKKRFFALILVLFFFTVGFFTLVMGSDSEAEDAVKEIISDMSEKNLPEIWRLEGDLEDWGEDAVEPIKKFIDAADPKVQVVLAHSTAARWG